MFQQDHRAYYADWS